MEARVRRKAWRAERMQLVGCTEGGTQEPHGTRDSMERCERCVNGAKPKRKGNGNSGGPRYSCERYTRTCRSHYYHVPKQRAPPEGPLPLFGTTVNTRNSKLLMNSTHHAKFFFFHMSRDKAKQLAWGRRLGRSDTRRCGGAGRCGARDLAGRREIVPMPLVHRFGWHNAQSWERLSWHT